MNPQYSHTRKNTINKQIGDALTIELIMNKAKLMNALTQENNQLIAEFEGYETYEMNGYINVHYSDDNVRTILDTYYHSSWDWLMPVVEKIEREYMYAVQLCWEHCIIDKAGENTEDFERIEVDSSDKLSATYGAVVEFIKQYNN